MGGNLSKTARAVLAMTAAGHSPRQIAESLGVSTQAVYKHLKRLRTAGLLPEGEAA